MQLADVSDRMSSNRRSDSSGSASPRRPKSDLQPHCQGRSHMPPGVSKLEAYSILAQQLDQQQRHISVRAAVQGTGLWSAGKVSSSQPANSSIDWHVG